MKTKTPDREGCGPLIPCACGCGKTLTQFDYRGRERAYLPGHQFKPYWVRRLPLVTK